MHKLAQAAFNLSLMVIGLSCACAQTPFPAQELKFDARLARFATRPDERITYVLLGSGFLRALAASNENQFITHWIDVHPRATAAPICTVNAARVGFRPNRIVYIWVEDKAECLNVALIREGIYAGYVMLDMVDTQRLVLEEFQDPKFSATRDQLAKEQAATPETDRPKRLITDSDYAARWKRIQTAELDAKAEKRGIWADAWKEEREAEGLE